MLGLQAVARPRDVVAERAVHQIAPDALGTILGVAAGCFPAQPGLSKYYSPGFNGRPKKVAAQTTSGQPFMLLNSSEAGAHTLEVRPLARCTNRRGGFTR
jgi:hypothetical protein